VVTTERLADNPAALAECWFRFNGGDWETLHGIEVGGRSVEPLTDIDLEFSVLVELVWDDAFAETRRARLVVEPWVIRPVSVIADVEADITVTADWPMLIAWLHDPATLLGGFLLRDDCTVTGDLWLLSAVEAVVSSAPLESGQTLLPLLMALEDEARRW